MTIATLRPAVPALLLLVCSCGGATPAPVHEPAVTVPTASALPPALVRTPDLTPVERPKSALLVGRVQRGALSWILRHRRSSTLATSPIQHLAPFLASALEGVVMANSPLEFVVGMRPLLSMAKGPRTALSVPLGSFDDAWNALRREARAERIELHPQAAGAVELVSADNPTLRCWLVASAGSSPARLLVGSIDDDLEEWAPYLARGLPVADLGSEPIAMEALPSQFAADYGSMLRGGSSLLPRLLAGGSSSVPHAFEPLLPELVEGTIDWMADIERLRIGARVDGSAMLVSVTTEFSAQSSWGARAIASLSSRPDSAKDMFSRLPADTELAWFSSGPEPLRTDEARASLSRWLRGAFGPTVNSSTIDLMSRTFLPRSPFVYAQGDASGEDATYTRSTGRGLWRRTLSTFGWHILGFDEPARQLEPPLDAGMQAYNSGDLRALVYRELSSLCPGMGKITKNKAPAGLPAGSILYEMKFPAAFFEDCMRHHNAKPPEPGPDESLVVIMVPDGARTWIGFGPQGSPRRLKVLKGGPVGDRYEYGPQENRMTLRMAALLKPALRGAPTIGALDTLGASSTKIGGFVTASGIGGLLRFVTMRESFKWNRTRMAKRPGRGTTPIPFVAELSPGGHPKLTVRLSLADHAAADLSGTKDETFALPDW